MKGDRNRSASERLNAKTLDQMFVIWWNRDTNAHRSYPTPY